MRTAVVGLLAAAVSAAAILRFAVVPPHHAMYVDEPWYAETACHLVRVGQLAVCEETWSGTTCTPYGKAWGWPVLLSPLVAVWGCATTLGIWLNRVLGVGTVLLVAVATRCAGGGWGQGAVAAAILAIHPVHVAWSATGETNVAAAAAELAGLCGALLYARRGRLFWATLAAAILALSTAIRPESLLPAVACAVALALVADAAPRQRRLVGAAIAAASIAVAAGSVSLWRMNADLSDGTFFSPRNVVTNTVGLFEVPGPPVNSAVALLALAGAVVAVRSGQRRAAWVLLAPAVAGAVIALAYDRFHERMLLGATAAALPLVGFLVAPVATQRLRVAAAGAGLLALAVLWSGPLVQASRPPETQWLETRIAARVGAAALEPGALVVAEQPTVLRAAGVERVMASARAVEDETRLLQRIAEGRAVHFLCDMYCEPGFQGASGPSSCGTMLRRFAMTPVIEEAVPGRRYILYRLTGPAAPGAPAPDCPRPAPRG